LKRLSASIVLLLLLLVPSAVANLGPDGGILNSNLTLNSDSTCTSPPPAGLGGSEPFGSGTCFVSDLTITSGVTLTVATGWNLDPNGPITNDGTIAISWTSGEGCLCMQPGGSIENAGSMSVGSNSALLLNSGASITNDGSLSTTGSGFINNGGTITDDCGSTFSGNEFGNPIVPNCSPSVSLSCSPSPVPANVATSCTVTVSGPSAPAPTGGVAFSSSDALGSFSSSSCGLSPISASSSSCTTDYTGNEVGTPTITAAYGGDTTYKTGSATFSLTVTVATTTTSVGCVPNSFGFGAMPGTTCTATVAGLSPTGSVSWGTSSGGGSFSSPNCTLSSGSCAVTYSDSSIGSPTITATYGGDSNNGGSSGTTGVSVTKRASSTSVACAPSPVPVNAPITCTVTVTDSDSGTAITPTGTVHFSSSGSGTFSHASCTLVSGTCSVSFTPSPGSEGVQKIIAKYAGDSAHLTSKGTDKVTVTKRTTSATLSCAPPFHAHTAITCTVTITDTSPGTPVAPSGKVSFSSSGPGTFSSGSCTLAPSGGSASCSVKFTPSNTGSYKITAAYAGDTDHHGSSKSQTFSVT
jgi:hypothetical protein